MRIDIITAVPRMLDSPLDESMLKKARERGVVEIEVHDLRDCAHDKHKTVDDSPYGGGAGMVLKPEPVFEAVEKLLAERTYDEVVLLTPDGETFTQRTANELSLKENLIFICGHYKGIDERIRERLATREISIGDYVLTGGEIAALAVVDSVIRVLPGALGDSESALNDSFQTGLLDSPQYTRPADFRGMKVPDVLLAGDHEKVKEWREQKSIERTSARRPDLMERYLSEPDAKKEQAQKF